MRVPKDIPRRSLIDATLTSFRARGRERRIVFGSEARGSVCLFLKRGEQRSVEGGCFRLIVLRSFPR